MGDLSYIDRDAEVKIVGQDNVSNRVNYVGADANGNMFVLPSNAGPVAPGTVAANSGLAGGVYNTTLPTLTNTQQAALQLTSSGALIVSTSGNTIDVGNLTNNNAAPAANNLGVLPALAEGTLSASRYTTGNQVLLVTDLAGNTNVDLQYYLGAAVSKTNPIATTISDGTNVITAAISAYGTAPTGTEVMGVNAYITNIPTVNQGTSPWLTKDSADGPVTPGTVAGFSQLIGGQYNTTLPTLTTGQQSAIQLDSSGRLLVSGITLDIAPATQTITTRDIASTTTTGANGQNFITGTPTAGSVATFAFTTEETVIVQTTGTWTGTLQLEVSMDGGTTWSPRPGHQDGTSYILNSFTNNFTAGVNVGGYTNFRLRAIAAMTGTVTVKIIESINQTLVYIGNALKLTDNSGNTTDITANGDLGVADIIDTAGQFRAQSVTTTAAEALGAATILANRKSLTITPTNGTVYWGFSNAVTTTTGTPIFKNQCMSFAIGAALHVYVISAGTVDCRMTEGA